MVRHFVLVVLLILEVLEHAALLVLVLGDGGLEHVDVGLQVLDLLLVGLVFGHEVDDARALYLAHALGVEAGALDGGFGFVTGVPSWFILAL